MGDLIEKVAVVGAGSGILARVASHLGADVEAVEIDPEASAVAAETLAADPPPRPIDWRTGGMECAGAGPFHGIVANVASSFFLKHADAVASRLEPGGVVIASGFLVADREDLDGAFGPHGISRIEAHASGPWSDWIGRRSGR